MFEKGHEKYGGRQKGTQNKITRDIKDVINKLLEYMTDDKIKDIASRVDNVKPEVLINFIGKIAPKDLNVSGEVTTNPLLEKLKQFDIKSDDNTNIT